MSERKGIMDWFLGGSVPDPDEVALHIRDLRAMSSALRSLSGQLVSSAGREWVDAQLNNVESILSTLLSSTRHSDTRPLTAKGAHSVYNGR